jgi:anaerobic selenocysteine-containing dehydrogenase
MSHEKELESRRRFLKIAAGTTAAAVVVGGLPPGASGGSAPQPDVPGQHFWFASSEPTRNSSAIQTSFADSKQKRPTSRPAHRLHRVAPV